MKRPGLHWLLLAVPLLTSGCGGGGSGASTPAQPRACGTWPATNFLPDTLPLSLITDMEPIGLCSLLIGGYYNASQPLSPSGNTEGFVARVDLDAQGEVSLAWRYALSTGRGDGVSEVERVSGGIRFLGWTEGTLPGETAFGGSDVVIGLLDANGGLLALSQLGDERPNKPLRLLPDGSGAFLMAGNDDIYIPTNFVESLEESWLARIYPDADGYAVDWLLRTGTPADDRYRAMKESADGQSVVLARESHGGAEGGLTVERRDRSGNLLWKTRLTFSPYDTVTDLHWINDAELLVLGSSYQDLGGLVGEADLLVAVLGAADGALHRIHQFGTAQTDWSAALAVDSQGLYAVSELFDFVAGTWGLRLARLTPDGVPVEEQWIQQGGYGTVTQARVVGGQLLLAGSQEGADGNLRGWLGAVELPSGGRAQGTDGPP